MNINMSGSGKVTIDGKSFTGKNIRIDGNKVIVDGETQDGELVGDISVQVAGNVDELSSVSGDIIVNGNAARVSSTSGDISCEDVSGDVKTVSGDVNADYIMGNVNTVSGDIYK